MSVIVAEGMNLDELQRLYQNCNLQHFTCLLIILLLQLGNVRGYVTRCV